MLVGILIAAFALRLHVVLGSTYHFDEEREWIPFAQSISVAPGNVNLPIRAIAHPILPAYFIKLGSLIAGENPLGFRLMSLLAGLGMIAVVALAAWRWRGPEAGLWAAALLAFNEYHIYVSTLAIDKPFQLLFCALAVGSFIDFLEKEKPRSLYIAGVMTGIAFLCKETSVLLLPGFLAVLVFSARHRPWLWRGAPYVAVAIFFAVISPDIFINMFLTDELQYSYADHLGRAAGIGFTRHHLLFFLRDVIAGIYGLMGEELYDLAPEYASMNALLGPLLLGVAAWMLLRLLWSPAARQDHVNMYLSFAFWAILGFFMSIEVSTEGRIQELVYVAWFWSDLTLIPAALMTGALLVSLRDRWRQVGYAGAAAAVVYAAGAAVFTRVGTPPGPVVGFNPEYVWPPNGQLVNVAARFNFCMICDKDVSIELLDVKLRQPDGSISSVLGTDYVTVPEHSRDGTELVLRARNADPAENPDERWQEWMWYAVSYTLTERSGRTHVVEDNVIFPLKSSQYGPRFWTGEPRGGDRASQ
jgi:hypothetical protein